MNGHIEPVRVVQNFMMDNLVSLLTVPPSLWNDDNISLLAQLAEKHNINTCDINSNENLLMYLLAVDKNVHGSLKKYQLLQEIMENQTQNATLLEQQIPALQRIMTIIRNGNFPSAYTEDLTKEISRFSTLKFVVQKNDEIAKRLVLSYKQKTDKKNSRDAKRLFEMFDIYTNKHRVSTIQMQKCQTLLINIEHAQEDNNQTRNIMEEIKHMHSVVMSEYESLKEHNAMSSRNKTRKSRSGSRRKTRSRK